MSKPFDYLIVGAGLFGAVMARELADKGWRVVVIEKRGHVAGQCHTIVRDGQITQAYGGHIFHTNDKRLWDYVNRFATFRQYSHHVKAMAGDKVYSFPPNHTTYQQMGYKNPSPAHDHHLRDDVRKTFFSGYTSKMWARPIEQVPPSVLARIPVRDDWNDEYFSDTYQGLPEHGYTPLIERLLAGIETRLNVDYLANRADLDALADHVIYSGPIDALFDNDQGRLEWRGMRFEHWLCDWTDVYQGCATMNYCDADIPWLREEEWKYFWKPSERLPYSWMSRHWPDNQESLYPVNDDTNNKRAAEYTMRAKAQGYILGGRLASYRYFDMHQVIAQALGLSKELGNVAR